MRVSKTATLAAFGIVVCGCGTTVTYVPTNTPPAPMQPKTSGDQVEVFTSTSPERPYQEVGMLRARQSSDFSVHDMPEIIAKLRSEAAEIGCDAISILGKDDKILGATTSHGSVLSSTRVKQVEGYQASCLVYTESAEAAAAGEPVPAAEPAADAAPQPHPTPDETRAPRDKAAIVKIDEATKLLGQGQQDKAEALALGTVQACEDRCSGPVKAHLWALAGISRCRRHDHDAAKEAFTNAVAEDSEVALDDAVADDTARAVFFEARAAAR